MFSGETDHDSVSSAAQTQGTSLDSISVRTEEAAIKANLKRDDTNDEAINGGIELIPQQQQVCDRIWQCFFFKLKTAFVIVIDGVILTFKLKIFELLKMRNK
jgi:hypothetical protein